jgi:hypothetical protein
MTASQRVVRDYLSVGLLRRMGLPCLGHEKEDAALVAVLPINEETGAVGPVETWMVEWMLIGDRALLPKPQRFWTGADLDHAISAALAEILNGGAHDG